MPIELQVLDQYKDIVLPCDWDQDSALEEQEEIAGPYQ